MTFERSALPEGYEHIEGWAAKLNDQVSYAIVFDSKLPDDGYSVSVAIIDADNTSHEIIFGERLPSLDAAVETASLHAGEPAQLEAMN